MDYRRTHLSGATWFFTVVTENRRPLLVDHIGRLRSAFRYCLDKHPFTIDAIVVLPDHLHTLWTLPAGDADYSARWMKLKRKLSSGLPAGPSNHSQARKREKGVWQRRFWEDLIRDERDLHRHLDYIHYNPVKHGYVQRVTDWPFSSFHRMVERGWYERDWGGEMPTEIVKMDLE